MLLVKTKIKESAINGIGLYADEFIIQGKVIWQWHAGFDQMFSPDDVNQLPEPARIELIRRSYFSEYLQKYVLCSDDARFMNHSHTPNTHDSGGPDHQALTIASRDIQIGEEITVNYFEYDGDASWKVRNAALIQRKTEGRAMSKRVVRVALAQFNCNRSAGESLAQVSVLVKQASEAGADIVCLPELFSGAYFCQYQNKTEYFSSAEIIPGPTSEALSRLAKQHHVVLVGGSIFEKTGTGRFYNSSVVFNSDGTPLGTYRKTHIPNDRCFYEQEYFSPGDTGVRVFDTGIGKVAVLICYDQWFPELARVAALLGAEIIFYPSAIGSFLDEIPEEGDWHSKWENIQIAHSIANNVFVAAVNRTGIEGNLAFWGSSFITDSFGTVIAQAGNQEQLLIADCAIDSVRRVQELWGFFQNRRPDAYGQIISAVEQV